MYYYSLHNRFITDVAGFEKMFKYQHVRAMFEKNLTEEDALIEIVKTMRDEWNKAKVAEKKVQARQQLDAVYSDTS